MEVETARNRVHVDLRTDDLDAEPQPADGDRSDA